MIYKSVSVDIDLDDFDDDDLIDEIESRGYTIDEFDRPMGSTISEMIEQLHQLRRTGRDYQQVLDRLIYNSIEKIT